MKNLEVPVNSDIHGLGSDKVVDVHGETNAFFDLHGRAVVGRVNDFHCLINMKVNLNKAEISGFKLHYIGGLNMLISFEDDIDASVFVLNTSLWKEWFVSLDIWSGQSLAYARIAWLKFQGVPLQLAENRVFNDIAALFGKVVKGSSLSLDDWDLSSSYVGVLVDHGASIVGTATLKWKNKKFKVWIMEEQEIWVPDCMLEEERKSRNYGSDMEVRNSEEGNDSSSEEDGESEVRSDNELDESTGMQDLERPESISPPLGTEQSKGINADDGHNSVFIGTARGIDDEFISKNGGIRRG
ncbi:hypothetical protein Hdeb2414_s0020g00558691 [Helianthus debilis subsp. tardiflorus]